ncbi:nuclear transcription factor Y subunit A-7-like isoform X1 [Primulina huaijiensis]|uniref:nuclear transcription factor Y subunit A-7-like isoform X1 n=1 Tax=Primulina huaijiensis TaxID=1492673 RepID=UPI003CC746D1
MDKTRSEGQCASSDSARDNSCGNHGFVVKPALFLGNPNFSINVSEAEINQPMIPYIYSNPYIGGLFTAFGARTMIQPHLMGPASGRVPLPVDLPDDGPIYVNAKQYNGILRRRQTRAKLEAQNKLVKSRKPYLHESRHVHALKRVRGSGGRFLSTKKPHQSDSRTPASSQNVDISCRDMHQFETNKHSTPPTTEGARIMGTDTVYQQPPDNRFSSAISTHVAGPVVGSGGLMYNGNRHFASVVQ